MIVKIKLTNLDTKFLGKNNIYYNEVDSTQLEIWRLYEKGIANGTLVMADIQTSGIGTHGRKWYTEEENNIAFSFLIKTNCSIKKLEGLTYETANIIVQIFKEKYNINLYIKKPNDVVYHNKKIGGILIETKIINEKVKALAVGIGINTSQTKFSENIRQIASSIKREFNIDINVQEFIEEFCKKFEKEITDYLV